MTVRLWTDVDPTGSQNGVLTYRPGARHAEVGVRVPWRVAYVIARIQMAIKAWLA